MLVRENAGIEKKPLADIASLEEAREIEREIKDRIQEISLQLVDKTRKSWFSDQGKKEIDYEEWRREACYAKMLLERRVRELRTHMKKQWLGFGVPFDLSGRILTASRDAFRNKIVTEEDVLLFFANPDLVRNHATMLDRARGYAVAAPPISRAYMIQLIAKVTRDERDLHELEEIWTAGFENPSMQSDVGKLLAHAYLVFDRHGEAELVAEEIPIAHEAHGLWLALFRVSGRSRYLDIARAKLMELRPIERFACWCFLLESTHSTDDLRQVREYFPKAVALSNVKEKRHLIVVYVSTLLKCGLHEDARMIVAENSPNDPMMLLRIASHTKNHEDLGKALRTTVLDGASDYLLDRTVEASIACNSIEVARAAIAACNATKFLADALCRLALETGTDDDLRSAAECLARMEAPPASDRSRLVLFNAFVKHGRIEEAKKQIDSFMQDEFRCKAYLRLHCLENGMECPEHFK